MNAEIWLGLSEAALILGLHPSTLRRWADSGKIPSSRTRSGRRRFDRATIQLISQEINQINPQHVTEQIELNAHDFTHRHTTDLANWQDGWFSRLSEEQTMVFRYSGQRLLGLMMQYISRSDSADTFLEEAKRIARDYGVIFFKVGLTVSQAAETFLHFRRSILESLQATSGLGGQNDADGLRVSLRTSDFFDALLVATIESHAKMSQQK
jgi:excisionase family DNA binding protein